MPISEVSKPSGKRQVGAILRIGRTLAVLIFQILRKIPILGRHVNLLFGKIIYVLDFFYPKNPKVIIFGSNSARYATGSPKVLFKQIRRRFPQFDAYYFLINGKERDQISSNSLRSLLTFLSAKFVVTSHGPGDFYLYRWSRRKKHISTWHGLPMKRAGLLRKNLTKKQAADGRKYTSIVDRYLVSSEYEKDLLARVYGYKPETSWLIGNPRNDILVDRNPGQKTILKETVNITGNETTVLYAPTFREVGSRWGEKRVELFPFEDFEKDKLFRFLEENNIVILIRAHVNDTQTVALEGSNRIIHFGFDVWADVNEILNEVDILITDYSSIAYDFLLIDRPIIYIPYDLEEYDVAPGFVVEDYDYWSPGIKVASLKDFLEYLGEVISGHEDLYLEDRKKIRDIIHTFQTSDTTSRFIELIRRL